MTERDYAEYSMKPVVVPAALAHQEGWVSYDKTGNAVITHPKVLEKTGEQVLVIPYKRRRPTIQALFDDLGKPLSSHANSPLLAGEKSLREEYLEQKAIFENLAMEAQTAGKPAVDYGHYVVDMVDDVLYQVAPAELYRLALMTSPGKLWEDPTNSLRWFDTRQKMSELVVGFAGASVGSNILEGWMREALPFELKLADRDFLDFTNFNRGNRASLRHIVNHLEPGFDPNTQIYTPRTSKSEYVAYEYHLVDPFAKIYVYNELNHSPDESGERSVVERFLLGDGVEPKIDVLVEETDDLNLKFELREKARDLGIPVLMASDLDHRAHVLFQRFKYPNASLGYQVTDQEIKAAMETSKRPRNRSEKFAYPDALCGPEFRQGTFGKWIKDEGEQPTASIPQSGATALMAGGWTAKTLVMFALGYEVPEKVVVDAKAMNIKLG